MKRRAFLIVALAALSLAAIPMVGSLRAKRAAGRCHQRVPVRRHHHLETFRNEWIIDTNQVYPIRFFVRSENPRYRYVPFPVNLIAVPLREALGIRPWATLRLFGVDQPGRLYLWGADDVGADVFSKVLYGARISLTIGILASLVSILIGMTLGGLAGFYGGWVDELILRFDEALSACCCR